MTPTFFNSTKPSLSDIPSPYSPSTPRNSQRALSPLIEVKQTATSTCPISPICSFGDPSLSPKRKYSPPHDESFRFTEFDRVRSPRNITIQPGTPRKTKHRSLITKGVSKLFEPHKEKPVGVELDDVLMEFKMKEKNDFKSFNLNEFSKTLAERSLMLFDNFEDIHSVMHADDCRMVVWRLSSIRRFFLNKMCKTTSPKEEVENYEIDMKDIAQVCFGEDPIPSEIEFARKIAENCGSVFDKTGDPIFSEEGVIEEISNEKLLDCIVDPHVPFKSLEGAVYAMYLYTNAQTLTEKLVDADRRVFGAMSLGQEYIEQALRERVMTVTSLFLQVTSGIRDLENPLSCFIDGNVYPTWFVNKMSRALRLTETPLSCRELRRTLPEPVKKRRNFSLAEIGSSFFTLNQTEVERRMTPGLKEWREDGDESERPDLFWSNISEKVFAEQFGYFDYENFMKIEPENLVCGESSSSLSKYLKMCENAKKWVSQNVTNKTSAEYFIRVAFKLEKQRMFNSSYLIFSGVEISKREDKFKYDKIKKDLENGYTKLERLYKGGHRHEEFWKHYESIASNIYRSFVVEFWVEELKSEEILTLYFDELINMEKVRAFGRKIKMWTEVRGIELPIFKNDMINASLTKYLCKLNV
ncbi:hypothetical protein EIN_173140 [Entamoeba invadens IP1]|uniref:Ras-GEF domain-containing protein n=1 Tax=Entamoeba invadens IP1 TaxID=370355 RepID=A0A0A1TVW2_ENTIV|nr:hypothetical protein EIN_173140 [Entamoeba invadens IP1]ELP84649.1 hypothetical protein EIN_173140 [Entamoeba invadens IP1]|eukprot:XP_004183995.1 hypothetical protein EIN_173140 [Entamoeba invadens IP1]